MALPPPNCWSKNENGLAVSNKYVNKDIEQGLVDVVLKSTYVVVMYLLPII